MNKKIVLLIIIIVSVYYYGFYDTKKQLVESLASSKEQINFVICALTGYTYSALETMEKEDPDSYKIFYDEAAIILKNDGNDVLNEYKTKSYISAGVFAVALFFFYK